MFVGIDLGSTNLKAALYDKNMQLLDRQSKPVTYIRDGGVVEFDGLAYVQDLKDLLAAIVKKNGVSALEGIAFTGQAESLVVLDEAGKPLMNVISWMDERSTEECAELAKQFPDEKCHSVTGQASVIPTWPATKILWLKNNRPELFARAKTYMLLKDYVVYCLTGVMQADMSIATFSFYFDIYKKQYWQEMLSAIGITAQQLPPLCEPCTVAGNLLTDVAKELGLQGSCPVNVGTLDHFAGMIGTGNLAPGGVTLSTGTVMAMGIMCQDRGAENVAMHNGFLPDTYVMLPVCESGGVSLEWFRRTCMPGMDYEEMNRVLAGRENTELLFLPYLVGTNAPEFDSEATGVFWGLRQEHDAYDMARAVMEGVAFVLRKNCQGLDLNGIIATGGGAKSPIWCKLQADITGLPVHIPAEKEAACLGAAMIAAVSGGRFADLRQAADACVTFAHTYEPEKQELLEQKYKRFCALYEASLQIAKI